ncbi:MAG: YARHG domain-containing protein [Chitinophagales bacterium]
MIFSQCKNTLEHLTDYIDSDPENVVKEVERTSSAAQNESINSPQVKVEELEREPNTLGMIGMYVGRFDNNMINITIESVEDGRVYGRSICAGNDRPLSGTYIYEGGNKFYLDLQEPGDDKYDGVFRAVVDLSISSMSGTWSPYNPSAASSKTFDIPKRTYRYDPNVGIWPETSRRELMYDELWEYTEEELNLMRNEIFARHGHSFKNIDLRRHFESQPWYIPIDDEVSDRLSRIERENVRFIKEAEDSYDEFFGR